MSSKTRDQPETPPPAPHAGPVIDNRGASIGQVVHVGGNASFGNISFAIPPPPPPLSAKESPPDPSTATSPSTTPVATILLCTANAVYRDERLRLEEELRAIADALQRSRLRDAFVPRICPAVTFTKVLHELDDQEPSFLHFSGHGDDSGELVLLGEREGEQRVPPEQVARLLAALRTRPTLVTFATCHSHELARAAARHAAFAIGFEGALDDESAPLFSATLYERLAARTPVDIPHAFEMARIACIGNGHETVELARLFERPGREVVVPQ
jgi:hypothetical protein